MSLQDWLQNHWLTEHTTSRDEVSGQLAAIDRDLQECTINSLSPEWRLSIAYAAAMRAAAIALAVTGFRATHEQRHYRTIQSLRYTINAEPDLIAEIDLFRKKRNATQYDQIQAISDHEAKRMIELATLLRDRIVKWLTETNPDLME
ncbi:MAG: hypothetical protein J7M24_07850 [Candidatus Latescibacteria bacterium]|nr:hypothetical protein [Candidatus Latescibacterota bacterium]